MGVRQHRRFTGSEEIVAVNEAICEAKAAADEAAPEERRLAEVSTPDE